MWVKFTHTKIGFPSFFRSVEFKPWEMAEFCSFAGLTPMRGALVVPSTFLSQPRFMLQYKRKVTFLVA
jgi:hypothetical protein